MLLKYLIGILFIGILLFLYEVNMNRIYRIFILLGKLLNLMSLVLTKKDMVL